MCVATMMMTDESVIHVALAIVGQKLHIAIVKAASGMHRGPEGTDACLKADYG